MDNWLLISQRHKTLSKEILMKKNKGMQATMSHSSHGPRPRLKFCPIHEILYLKKYPHVCDGIPVKKKAHLKGRKKKR